METKERKINNKKDDLYMVLQEITKKNLTE